MNKKKVLQEIKKALDNLDGVKISNSLKAEAILEAISEEIQPMKAIGNFILVKGNSNDENSI